MAFWNKNKKRGSVNVSVKSVEPLRGMEHPEPSYSLPDYEKKDLAYKKQIRILRFISRFITLILNVAMMGTMSFSLYKYFTTKNSKAGGQSAWNQGTVIWPSIMVLAIATITFVLNLSTLISYCCSGVKTANKISSVTSVFGYVVMLAHLIAWATVAGVFRALRNGEDIWGYTCSATADAIQEQVQSFVNFGKLCNMQQGTWYVTIVEAVVYLLSFVSLVMMTRRASHKKRINQIRENMAMETGYAHNQGQGYDTGARGDGKKYMPIA